MTSEPSDMERVVRQWLAETAPDQAPASLREALEREVDRPPGRARPWPRLGHDGLRFAGRVAAALAILAMVGTGAYFYGTSRANAPGATGSPHPTASAESTHQASDTPGADQLVGDWHLVNTSFQDDQPGAFQTGHLTEIAALAAGGFVAFIYDSTVDETVVYHSGDGTAWDESGTLPTKNATLTSVAEWGGRVVASGYVYDSLARRATPMAWASTDLHTWHAAVLPAPANTGVDAVAAGPAGLLAFGYVISLQLPAVVTFWQSTDGLTWHTLTTKGLSTSGFVEDLSASSSGYVVRTDDGRPHAWQSVDGVEWTEAWTSTDLPATALYSMGGPTYKAPDGGYVTFGSGAGDSALWTSPDLAHWTMAGRMTSYGGIASSFGSVPGGFVGAGLCTVNQPYCPDGLLAVWTSTDGLWWQLVPGTTDLVDRNLGLEVNYVISGGRHAIVVTKDSSDQIHLLVGTELK